MSKPVTREHVAQLLRTYCLVEKVPDAITSRAEVPDAIARRIVDLLIWRGFFTEKRGHVDVWGKRRVTSLPVDQACRELHQAVWRARSDIVIGSVVLPLVNFFDEGPPPGGSDVDRFEAMQAHNNRRLIGALLRNKEYVFLQMDSTEHDLAAPIVKWLETLYSPVGAGEGTSPRSIDEAGNCLITRRRLAKHLGVDGAPWLKKKWPTEKPTPAVAAPGHSGRSSLFRLGDLYESFRRAAAPKPIPELKLSGELLKLFEDPDESTPKKSTAKEARQTTKKHRQSTTKHTASKKALDAPP